MYNIDLKQVVDLTKPPPNIKPITPGIFIFEMELIYVILIFYVYNANLLTKLKYKFIYIFNCSFIISSIRVYLVFFFIFTLLNIYVILTFHGDYFSLICN